MHYRNPVNVQVQLTAGQVPYAQHYGIAEKPLSIKGYLGAMDKYLPRLTAVLEHGRTEQKDDASAGSVGSLADDRTRLSLLRRLLTNQSAIDALRLPHYVFDGQIEQKLQDFDEELLGGTFHAAVRLRHATLASHRHCALLGLRLFAVA